MAAGKSPLSPFFPNREFARLNSNPSLEKRGKGRFWSFWTFLLAFCFFALGLGLSSTVLAAASSVGIRVGYPQPSGAMLPLWLVSDAKLDQKYGVPLQNIVISGAARMNHRA